MPKCNHTNDFTLGRLPMKKINSGMLVRVHREYIFVDQQQNIHMII